jgi:hypothetical protein
MLVRITLNDSFDVRSISDVYHGGNVPPEFYTVTSQRIICAKTGGSFTQPDSSKLVLVAVPPAKTVKEITPPGLPPD